MDAMSITIKAIAVGGVLLGTSGLASLIMGGPVPPENLMRISLLVLGVIAVIASADMLRDAVGHGRVG